MIKLISVVPIGEIKIQDRYILQNITLASSIIRVNNYFSYELRVSMILFFSFFELTCSRTLRIA